MQSFLFCRFSPRFSSFQKPEKYQPSNRERVENGAKVKIGDYVQARRDIDLLRREINKTFASFDLLITTTMPTLPVPITPGADPTAVRYRNTMPCDILRLPAISVPCSFPSGGLPVGLQIAGASFAGLRMGERMAQKTSELS
jgi:aspartyl-tRNA(Asn)/glutamyl-tRNA(Gln) amidotransferase subunit A